MPPRRASAGEWTVRSRPRTAIVPASGRTAPGQDLDERALAGAVGAHERVDLARPHGERGRLQRDDGAIRLRDAGRLEQQLSRGERSSSPSRGMRTGAAGGAGDPRSMTAGSGYRRPCRRRDRVRDRRSSSPSIDEAERPQRVHARDGLPGLELRLARVGQVVDQRPDRAGPCSACGAGRGLDRLAVEELEASVTPAPPTAAVLVTAAPFRSGKPRRVEELRDEAADVGIGDRHERLVRRP